MEGRKERVGGQSGDKRGDRGREEEEDGIGK